MEFKKYPHIERLDSEEVEGLLDLPNIYIEPKLDGANALIWLDETGTLQVGKRTAAIAADDDFRGLRTHIYNDTAKYMTFFKHFPGTIIYGEWLVKHTFKDYRDTAWNKFYAFDLLNCWGKFYDIDERIKIFVDFNILQTSPLAKLKGPLLTSQMDILQVYLNEKNTFLIDTPGIVGEGIVLKAFDSEGKPYVNKHGRTCWAKMVRQEFKEAHTVNMGINNLKLQKEFESMFVEQFITLGRIEKMKAKIITDKGASGWQSKFIGELIGRVYYDAFSEELWHFVTKEKVQNLNFKDLSKIATLKIKSLIGL